MACSFNLVTAGYSRGFHCLQQRYDIYYYNNPAHLDNSVCDNNTTRINRDN